MSERDPSHNGESSRADGTLMGVAPPRIDSTPDSALRRPVFVRSGTSVAETEQEPPPLPRMALPSRPVLPNGAGASDVPPAFSSNDGLGGGAGLAARARRALQQSPSLWMVAAPVVLAMLVIGGVLVLAPKPKGGQSQSAPGSNAAVAVAPSGIAAAKPKAAGLPQLAGKSADSLSAAELLALSAARSESKREAARALRQKLQSSPQLATDKAVQAELFKLAADAETAGDALAAMAAAPAPVGADLLYEVWTGTSARTDATELARALVYSSDVRPKASPALQVALELRAAEKCEQSRDALRKAAKDGDRRSLHLLTKLASKRGCGPKKNQDCYACLRDPPDELVAALSAVKARRQPAYPPVSQTR